MIKALIFDLDGVLVFTDHYHFLGWKALADREGIYFDETINHRLRGVSRMDSLDIILEKANGNYSREEKEAMANFKNDAYRRLLDKMGPQDVDDEIRLLLKKWKDDGLLLAVASSSKNARYILEKVALTPIFDAVVDGSEISRSKPAPDVFLLASQRLNVAPSEAIVIEDANAGIDAAKAGGFLACGIGHARNYLNADIKITHLRELAPHLY